MEIDKEYGAKLKNFLEALQPSPVNVFDRHGVVVAAADPEEVGRMRAAALQMMDTWPEPLQSGYGMCCIRLKKIMVGAVELVGLSEENLFIMDLVKTASEMFLEKEGMYLQKGSVNGELRTMLTLLVGVQPKDDTTLENKLTECGFDFTVPRTTLLLRLTPVETMTFTHTVREIIVDKQQTQHAANVILDQLPQYFSKKEDYILTYPEQQKAIILCADRQKVLDANVMNLASICRSLEQLIQVDRFLKLHAVIGNRCCCVKDYERQYEQLEMRLKAGQLLRPDQNILLGSSMVLGSIILYSGQDNRRRITRYIFGRLLKHPQRDILLETLHTYFACDMNATQTAQKLFIHRNTLQQRLRHIEELTGYSAYTANGLLTLRVGLLHYSSLLNDNDLDSVLSP